MSWLFKTVFKTIISLCHTSVMMAKPMKPCAEEINRLFSVLMMKSVSRSKSISPFFVSQHKTPSVLIYRRNTDYVIIKWRTFKPIDPAGGTQWDKVGARVPLSSGIDPLIRFLFHWNPYQFCSIRPSLSAIKQSRRGQGVYFHVDIAESTWHESRQYFFTVFNIMFIILLCAIIQNVL